MRVVKAQASDTDFSGGDLGSNDYVDCHFERARLRDAHLENCSFVHCDFTDVDIRRAVFRLSCRTGSGNHIDATNAVAFLYWLNHMFDLPPEIRAQIEPIIVPYKRRLTVLFAEET